MKTRFILSSVVALYALVAVDAVVDVDATYIITAGAAIINANAGGGNHFCWTAKADGLAPTAVCNDAATATDLGQDGCGKVGAGGTNTDLLWTTPVTHLSIIECKAKVAQGGAKAVKVYQKQIAMTSLAVRTLTIANLGTGNHLCWSAGSSASLAPLKVCGAANAKTDPGISGCGNKNVKVLTWTGLTASNAYVSVLQCTGTTVVGVALAVKVDPVATTTAVLNGLTQTVKGGTKIRFTGIGFGNHLCWNVKSGSAPAARTCSVAGVVTKFGKADNTCTKAKTDDKNYTDVEWDEYAITHFSVIQCNGTTPVGSALTLQLTEAQISFPNGATQSVRKTGPVAVDGVGATQYVCWTSGPFATTPIEQCGAKGAATDLGADGCGKASVGTFTWDATKPSVSMIQCNGLGVSVGTAISLTLSEKNIAFVNGDTQSLTFNAGANVIVSGLGTGNYLCWTSGQTLTEIKACAAAAGAETDVGVSGCGGANTVSFTMLYNSTKKVSMIECSGGEVVGNAISLTLSNAVETQLAETKGVKKVVDAMTTTLNVMNVSVSIVPLFLLGVFGSLFAFTM